MNLTSLSRKLLIGLFVVLTFSNTANISAVSAALPAGSIQNWHSVQKDYDRIFQAFNNNGFTARGVNCSPLLLSSYQLKQNPATPVSVRPYAQVLYNKANLLCADVTLISLYKYVSLQEQRSDYHSVVDAYWALFDAITRYNNSATHVTTTTTAASGCNAWWALVPNPPKATAVVQGKHLNVTWVYGVNSHINGFTVHVYNNAQHQASLAHPSVWPGTVIWQDLFGNTVRSFTTGNLPPGLYYVGVEAFNRGMDCGTGDIPAGPYRIL